tara:strand:+ start:1077 stop:2207 length:1131 start_codon:yes stop_codon:yes gene_type:complete
MEQIIEAKRDLGEGRWDKILKRKMVELSFADTYEEARDEWEATGNVYKHTHRGNEPEWTNGHTGHCLCGHPVVYHFEIHNTVTNVRECVGSDHIGAYLIIRQLVNLGHQEEEITDKMIEDWLKDRVQTMKAEAWWKENGEHFTEMYNAIQELDRAVNIKDRQIRFNGNTYHYKYIPKTRATGKLGDRGYQMASIVYRWDDPNNPKRQLDKYGYPNDRLWADLNLFYHTRHLYQHKLDNDIKTINDYNTQHRERQIADAERAAKLKAKREAERIAWEAGAEERERKRLAQIKEDKRQAILRRKREAERAKTIMEKSSETFTNMCDYYGIKEFSIEEHYNSHQIRSLASIKQMIIDGNELQRHHLDQLKRLLGEINNE